jgi:hypothetical protein
MKHVVAAGGLLLLALVSGQTPAKAQGLGNLGLGNLGLGNLGLGNLLNNPLSVGVAIPNVVDVTINVPTIITTGPNGPTVVLPNINLPSIVQLDVSGLQNLSLPTGDTLLLINLGGISLAVPNVPAVTQLGNSVLGVVLDQVAPVNQVLATTTNVAVLSPVQQLIDHQTSTGTGSLDRTETVVSGSTAFAPTPVSNLWMWNAVNIGTTKHDGFQFKAGSGDGQITGSTLGVRSVDRSETPGLLWDASTLAGLRPGTLHFGLSAGISESDLDAAGSAAKDLGVDGATTARLRSWSAGAFALLTMPSWYAGVAAGGSWGKAEITNPVTGAESDFDGSSVTSALFLGKVVPLTGDVRLDLRGTLGYQHSVGDAHEDAIGFSYGEQTIESFDGSLSARLFGVVRTGSVTLRPYVQAGVAHRFHYENAVQIQGVDFAFEDADTSVFAAGGIDLEITQTLQVSVGARYDHSADFDSVVGRFGVIMKLN